MNKTKHFKRTAFPLSAKSMVSLMLLLIAMLMPQRVWATDFISEVKISVEKGNSGSNAKSRLTNDKYTLVDADLNQGGGGHYVYIGYKTSTNAADAITGLLIVESSSEFDCHAIANITTSAFTYNGKKYYRCTSYDAGDARLDCDLNRGRGSGTPDITLYYTKDGNTTNGGTLLTSISVVGNTTTTGVTYTRHWKYNDAQNGTTNDDVYGNTNKGGTAHYITYTTHTHAFSDADYDTNNHKLWCASCGYVSAYNAHVWENTGSKISDATCTQAAKYYQKCKWCKRTGDDNHFYTTSALGHGTNNTGYTPTWTWGGKYNEATCTFALKCNRCKLEVSKQNLTPTKVTDSHVDPTCAKNGNERWTVAAVSYSNSKTNDASYTGSAQTKDYVISALGHTFAANDLAKSVCQRCNHGFFRYKSTTGKAVVLTAYNDAVFLDENNKTLDYTNTYVDGNGVMECERPIVTIVSSSFRESKGFTGDLIIPNTVKTIGSRAFELTEFNGNLIIPNSVTSIGESAFCECKNLTGDITIPNSVTSLEFRTFYKCSGFNGTLTIPNSITRIERDVFFDCKGLTGNLTIPNSVTSIGQSAFYGTGFTGNLSIPNSVTSIGNEAFSYCEKLSGTLTLPNSITSIGERTFNHCPGLTGNLTIPNSVTSIGESAFFGTGFTGNLTIPNSVISIGNHAFRECNNLTGTLTLGNSVKSIGSQAFLSARLTGVLTIPNSVTEIGNTAFWGCKGFTCVTFESVPKVGNLAFSDITTNMSANLCASSYVYKGDNPNFPAVASVTAPCTLDLTDSAVAGHSNLTRTHTFADNDSAKSVCTVCSHTFFRYSAKEKVTPETGTLLDSIGNDIYNSDKHTFADSLGVMEFDGLLATIGDNAFYKSKFTGSLIIPKSVTTIGYRAFFRCTGFTGNLIIPESVTSIEEEAFYNCNYFTGNLNLPNSVTSIGKGAFSGCGGFTGSLIIPNTVTNISDWAFSYCTGFTGDLIIPNSVTSVGESAFSNCIGFNGNLYIPESVTSIGEEAFYNTHNLRGNLIIPKSVTSIGNKAFCACQRFTSVEMRSVPQMGSDIFSYTNASKCLVLSDDSYVYKGDNPYFPEVTSIIVPCTLDITGSVVENHPKLIHTNGERIVDAAVAATCTTTGLTEGTHCNLCNKPLVAQEVIPALGHTPVTDASIAATCTTDGLTEGSHCEVCHAVLVAQEVIPAGHTFADNDPGHTYCSVCEHTFFRYTATEKVTPNVGTLLDSTGNDIYNSDKNTFADGQGVMEFDKPLATIGGSAFFYHLSFTGDLTIPNSVTSIGYWAFWGCSGFTGNLTIPNSVTSIGNNAFYNCSGFTGNLTIPNSVTNIEAYAFWGCSGFTGNLTIPNSVTSIGNNAFCNCSGFKGNLTIGNSVTSIGNGAFSGCSGFTGNLTIPNSVTSIGEYAFRGCYGLTGMEFLSVPSVGIDAFSNVNCSKTVILSEDSYVYKGSNPDFPAVASVTAPCALDLTGSVVENHPNLVHTNGEIIVDAAVAATCTTTGLTEGTHCNLCNKPLVAQEVVPATGHTPVIDASIAATCTTDGLTEGSHCDACHEVFVAQEVIPATGIHTFADDDPGQTYCPVCEHTFFRYTSSTNEAVAPYDASELKGANGAKLDFTNTYVDGHGVMEFKGTLKTIGANAFWNRSSFTGDLTIPNSVTSIGYCAFLGCSGFNGNLSIPNSVTSIGEAAFSYCYGLTGVEFQSVPYIYPLAFEDTECPKTVILSDDSYVYIGENPDFPAVASVTYNRNLAAGKTVTFMLPFDVPVENINGKVYELSGFDGETLSFSKPADGIAHANKPYLLAEPEEGNLMISPVSAISAGNPQTIAADNAEMWGTYTKQTGIFSTDRESIYGYAGGQFVRQQSVAEGATKGATLKPFRALIKVRELENGAPAARLALSLDEETIGVISVSDDELNTLPVNVYDMNGRLVRANVDPMTCLKGLPKGMYVVRTLSAPQGGTSPFKERVVYKQMGE